MKGSMLPKRTILLVTPVKWARLQGRVLTQTPWTQHPPVRAQSPRQDPKTSWLPSSGNKVMPAENVWTISSTWWVILLNEICLSLTMHWFSSRWHLFDAYWWFFFMKTARNASNFTLIYRHKKVQSQQLTYQSVN